MNCVHFSLSFFGGLSMPLIEITSNFYFIILGLPRVSDSSLHEVLYSPCNRPKLNFTICGCNGFYFPFIIFEVVSLVQVFNVHSTSGDFMK